MNNYPVWWDSTLTIYNKYTDPQTQVVVWHRHIVYNCFWKDIGNKVSIGNTVLETNNLIARIPKDVSFLPQYEWIALPNDTMPYYFTLGVGDIVVLGAVDDEIDEYKAGKRSSDFVKKYKALQGCMEIQKVGINVGIGRGNEHYSIIGI